MRVFSAVLFLVLTQEGLVGGSHHISFLEFVKCKNGIVV